MEGQTSKATEQILLSSILDLLKVAQQMASEQSRDHASLTKITYQTQEQQEAGLKQLHRRLEKDTSETQQTMKSLLESIEVLGNTVGSLVDAANKSNELAAKQNQLLQEIRDTLAENTSRIGTLNMAVAKQTGDPGLGPLYEELGTKG